MRTFVASLAAVLALIAPASLAGCGEEGAEPDAPTGGAQPARGLDLVLDFQPNAVHAGIYVARQEGLFADAGIEVAVREPGNSSDAPKLLRTGRADLAILDIHDLAIAREQGIDLVGVAAIVQRPLAAVIAADGEEVRRPADLEGRRIGVTGLPSDDAVLATVLSAGGLAPADVDTVTIGFEAVPALLAGKLDAATAFWNAEGVVLGGSLPTREFRVDDFGAPSYPELVLVTTPEKLAANRDAISAAVAAIGEGYALTREDPEAALGDLLEAVPELDEDGQRAQLEAVLPAFGSSGALSEPVLRKWARWDAENGIVAEPPDVDAAFDFEVAAPGGNPGPGSGAE